MHELGIVMSIIKDTEEYMTQNNLQSIEKIVLQVGALSGVVPKYLTDVFPMAIMDTKLSNTVLEVEETLGIGICNACGFRYDLIQNNNTCPLCKDTSFSIISGKEFMIKELHTLE
ncbi:MAG: hydrogenase maturation nickel metallochaperone HypA [Firmicutes bacterium]|nr:hydrogenase maturation nickel metallochaperone HypA [Bacillota bacterium]